MKTKIRKSAAELAHEEMVRTIPRKQIDHELLDALRRAKLWYALHGKRFRMPTGGLLSETAVVVHLNCWSRFMLFVR